LPAPLIVLDTGVVLRALAGEEDSSSYRIVRAAGTGSVRPVLSDEFLRELVAVARRPRLERRIDASRALEVGLDLGVMGELYRPRRLDWPSIPDPQDYWVLDLAFASGADYIVSWDPHLTQAKIPFPVEVLEPPALLARLPS
jgi:putative PIN family toxin of toxin-antitoxin system